jgi:hypothetical protein
MLEREVSELKRAISEISKKIDELGARAVGGGAVPSAIPLGPVAVLREEEEEVEGPFSIKRVMFTPAMLYYYQWYKVKKGQKGMSLDEFLREVIYDHFENCLGVKVGVVVKKRREEAEVEATG